MLNPPPISLPTHPPVVPLEEEDILRKIRQARNIRSIENIFTGPVLIIHGMNRMNLSLCADQPCPSSSGKLENSEFNPNYIPVIFVLTGLLMFFSIVHLWRQMRNCLEYLEHNSDLVLQKSVRSIRNLAQLSIITLIPGVIVHYAKYNATWFILLCFGAIYKFYVVAACQGYLNLFDSKETPIKQDSQIRDDQAGQLQECRGSQDHTSFDRFTNLPVVREGLVASYLLQALGIRDEVIVTPVARISENPPADDPPPCYELALLARDDPSSPPTYREAMSVSEEYENQLV
ncbi:uncharacterized protein LOC118437834 [Folsomia candida]|uniref:uncharacterized protein LOC118437834 n=1 Tax=Folsomia candida TaxID=158441 RepID=UPI001605101E|nr:uncharacterized protein LOC118437834 [Folsomia candida]